METSQIVKVEIKNFGKVKVPKGVKLTRQKGIKPNKYLYFVSDTDWIKKENSKISNLLKMYAENYGINIPEKFVKI